MMPFRPARVPLGSVLYGAPLLLLAACAPPPAIPAVSPAPCPVATPAPSASPAPARIAKSLDDAAGDVVDRWNAVDTDGLFAMFDANMQLAVPLATLSGMMHSSRDVIGKITAHKRASGQDSPTRADYTLTAEHGEWTMKIALDDKGLVSYLLLQPGADVGEAPPVEKSTIPLGLPFKGEWSVLWGGATKEVNEHIGNASQRRAADLLRLGPDGLSHRGSGSSNADYYAYGEEIIAAADGTVVEAVDGVPENTPGERNTWLIPGNVVLLEHGPGVYSAYAHMKTGSIRVKAGAKVKRGQTLGLCGNSGNSTEPHLHFQLQNGVRFEKSWGIEPVFASVTLTRDGKTAVAKDYTFLKGDRLGEPLPK